MALRPLLLSAVVGIAALGAFHTPVAEAAGSVSFSIGTSPHYRSQQYGSGYGGRYDGGYNQRYGGRYGGRYDDRRYGHHGGGYYQGSPYARHRPEYTFVPGHWAYGQRGRVWVPDQYVPVPPRYDRRYDGGYGHGYDSQVIYRSTNHPQPLPGGFYDQRGGG